MKVYYKDTEDGTIICKDGNQVTCLQCDSTENCDRGSRDRLRCFNNYKSDFVRISENDAFIELI